MASNLKRQAILDYEEATAKLSWALGTANNAIAADAEFQKVRFFPLRNIYLEIMYLCTNETNYTR